MQGQEAALLELGLSDHESVCGHVVEAQCQGLRNPHAGRGNEAEERRVQERPDRARGPERRGGPKQPRDLVGSIDVGRAALGRGAPERFRLGNLMTRIPGVHRQREAPHREQPVAAVLRGWRLAGPVEHAGGSDVSVAALLRERDEASEQDRLAAELEAQRALAVDVSFKISAQHHAPPGQGCAIWRSIVTSTLA
jgi:hypothetical protein